MAGNEPDDTVPIGDELLAERRAGPGKRMPDDMHPVARATIHTIDTISEWVGRVVALLVVPIILAMVYEVIARKFFIAPTLWAFDISRMLYGMSFMLGAAYALMHGLHIRADFLYRNFEVRTQGRVDLVLYIVLFMPAMIFLLIAGYEFALKSVLQGERAGDSTWAPVVWPVKVALAVGVALLLVQGVSEILKSWYAATRGRWPS
ncbi:TRAP-type mannitol/chloroaromatic compound transport system permease small subunit [Hoeflea halophila]|uniref:TRAP transporter small permease protein n=1 Tax=Hoeflea halophila TaxID=714899 RepID=A0A286IAC2_9HYPH|nr:TRAP transporter small permease subunit [Hoeflea halophila]SOE17012.1 TRAP-type mannitol/chloroaromatic compound transport system permease small subunit [Hoeflea halophila]